MGYLQCQILDELIRTSGSRKEYDLWVRQDNLSLKNGVYIFNLNGISNVSYECNTTYHLRSVSVENLGFLLICALLTF